MTAGIDEGVDLVILVARDEDRLTADVGREIVVLVRNLALVCQIDSVALEDVLYLEFEDARIGEDFTTDTVDATRDVILHRCAKHFLDRVERRFLPLWLVGASLKHCGCHGGLPAVAD